MGIDNIESPKNPREIIDAYVREVMVQEAHLPENEKTFHDYFMLDDLADEDIDLYIRSIADEPIREDVIARQRYLVEHGTPTQRDLLFHIGKKYKI